MNVEEEEIVREAVELVWKSGKIPYKCPLKVLESDLIVENEKVKEVHLTLDCGGKIFKAKVDWQNKKVILVENAQRELSASVLTHSDKRRICGLLSLATQGEHISAKFGSAAKHRV